MRRTKSTTIHNGRSRGTAGRRGRVLLIALLPALAGCAETDSFLLDPAVVGRWEHTPTRVPILSRIASIEGPEDEFVEYSDVTPADLIPEVAEYRLGPGDRLTVTVFDIPEESKATPYERIVDTRGFIDIPQLGSLYVNGLTAHEAADVVKIAMRPLIAEPLAFVVVDQMRTQRFAVFGAVQTPGQYAIPVAEYRLLEGLTAAGGFSEAPGYLYVIRQVPLTQSAGGQPTSPATAPPPSGMQPNKPTGDSLIDVIDQLSRPGGQTPPPAPGGAKPSPVPAPGPPPPPTGPTGMTGTPNGAAPAPKPPAPKGSPAVLQPVGSGAKQPADRRPPVDLIDPTKPVAPAQPASTAPPQPPADSSEGTWVNIDGRWVKVRKPQVETAMPPEHLPGMPARGELAVTQRVIRIPTSRVALGDARYNIIIRPGDVVRVPPQPSGTIFISGQVARVGAYSLTEGLTLTRAITSAGGLSAIAIPERMDLVRMVGPNQQGFVRLNLRAMEEGTHPDVFLKPNDRINIGTNFWATPMAVIRNGFRASYGFGLIADRNFGDDIFGAPPTNQFGD